MNTNMNRKKLVKKLNELNPGLNASESKDSDIVIIIGSSAETDNINLPVGYYYLTKNIITNKYSFNSSTYEHYLILH